MRWLIWILLILSTAVGLALVMRFNHGNVAILWPPYRVDFSVNFAVLLLVLAFFVVHLVLLGIGKALDLPARVRDYRQRRRSDSARLALRDSLLALFEGRFGRAERLAQTAREDEQLAGAAALVAARAAHRMREFERRDGWLELAEGDRASAQAERMSAAEFALDEQQPGRALAAIERFHGSGPKHIQSLRTALRAYEQSSDWQQVLPVLRLLEKRDALPEPAIRGMRARACRGLFAQPDLDAAGVKALLRSLKAAEREMPETIEAAAAAYARAGDETQARKLIESAMKTEYSPLLLRRYARLDAVPARERIELAEQWLSSYGDDGALSLVLGRLCMAESLWGKAEEFLERSLTRAESAAAHVALAELFEAIGKPQDAARHFRAAALLQEGQSAGTSVV